MERTNTYRFDQVHTNIDVDLEARAVAGVGWNAVEGVGRRIRLQMSQAQWARFLQSARQVADSPSLEGLVQALQGMQLDVRYDDRWIAGGAAGFGGSVAGWGASFGGEALWHDRGAERIYTLDAGALLRGATDTREVQTVLAGLVARLP